MLLWNPWNKESAGVAHRPGAFTSTPLGEKPLTRQTRHTFKCSRANLNGPIRYTFIVFCSNQSETILLQGSQEFLISLLDIHRRALGRDWKPLIYGFWRNAHDQYTNLLARPLLIALQVVRTSFGFHLRECMGSSFPPSGCSL